MILRSPLLLLLITLSLPLALASAATPTSFCKCTCFSNSTIIALDARTSTLSAHSLLVRNPNPNAHTNTERDDQDAKDKQNEDGRKEYRAGNCNDCNRQFCLGYNLPICKGAGLEDVFTMCFQRDSRKDEAVVFVFIAATAGLLGWAAVKPWVGKWVESARERRNYIPVSNQGGGP